MDQSVECPACHERFARRAPRQGALEGLLSVVYVYPFRCQLCGRRFRRLRWGIRYRTRHVRSGADRREYERLATRLPARVSAGGDTHEGLVRDLSRVGATVESAARLPVGATLRLQLDFTLERADGQQRITIDRAIVRSTRSNALGVQFLGLDREDQERLVRVLRHLLLAQRPGE